MIVSSLTSLSCRGTGEQGCQIWHPNWARLDPNGTSETDLKKSQICPIWGPIWPNLNAKFDIPTRRRKLRLSRAGLIYVIIVILLIE